jgi:hypothetical protein
MRGAEIGDQRSEIGDRGKAGRRDFPVAGLSERLSGKAEVGDRRSEIGEKRAGAIFLSQVFPSDPPARLGRLSLISDL